MKDAKFGCALVLLALISVFGILAMAVAGMGRSSYPPALWLLVPTACFLAVLRLIISDRRD